MVGPLGAQANAGSVIEPEPTSFGLFGRDFQPLAPPDPFDPLVVDAPTRRCPKQLRDLPVAVTAILAGKLDDVGGQPLLIVASHRNTALRGTVLSENPANPALGQLQFGSYMTNAGAAARGAQKFPLAASARIILSRVRSDTARRSRAFSASSSFSLRT